MNGAGRFHRQGIIHPAGKNWQELEPRLKGQSANSLLPALSAPAPGRFAHPPPPGSPPWPPCEAPLSGQ